jgi:hypothetical protein
MVAMAESVTVCGTFFMILGAIAWSDRHCNPRLRRAHRAINLLMKDARTSLDAGG